MAGDSWTREELLRVARLKFHHAPTSLILSELGRHTADSIDMAWANLQGRLEHASELMQEVAADLDADPYYEGWRDV